MKVCKEKEMTRVRVANTQYGEKERIAGSEREKRYKRDMKERRETIDIANMIERD